jgi:hypothetical protein
MTPNGCCASCRRAEGDILPLWDRQSYCADCLQAATPALLGAARTMSELREELHFPLRRVFWSWFRFLTLASGSVGLIFPLIILLSDPIRFGAGLLAWAGLALLGLPVLVVFAAAATLGARDNRPTVSVVDGAVVLTRGRSTEVVPLSDCEWVLGNVSQMTVMTQVAVLSDPAVILVLPSDADAVPRRVAVGLTDETREIWTAFLRLSKTPERTAWPSPRALSRNTIRVATFLLVPITFLAILAVGKLASTLIALCFADRGVGTIVGVVILMYGTVSAAFYGALYFPGRPFRLVPTRSSPARQRQLHRRMIIGWLLVNTTFFGLPLTLIWNNRLDLSVTARMTGIALSYAWSFLASYDLGRRMSRFDPEFAGPVAQARDDTGVGRKVSRL